jgi:HK97 family phage major capsid protein
VSALFDRIDMPTSPWTWPLEGADATAYRVAEPTGDTEAKFTASTPGTNKVTYDAEIFGIRALTSKFLEADSAVAILPYVTKKFVQAMVDGEEKAILDGDTDGTHQDSDIGASTTAAVTAWDGLRKKGLAETTQAITTTTSGNLNLLRKSMTKWGINPADLAFIVGVSSYGVLMSDSNLLTVDKMGPQATILSGQVGSIFGVPVIVSEWVRETLNASGVYDGITTTKTYALCVNKGEWAMGTRMALDVEADDSIYRETAQRVLVGFAREDFQCITSATTDDATSIGYNITSGS